MTESFVNGADAIAALPDSIRVGSLVFKVVKWARYEASSGQNWGEFSSVEQSLRFNTGIPRADKAADTVIHEVLHAIFYTSNVYDEDKEERIVDMTAKAWVGVYRDNP